MLTQSSPDAFDAAPVPVDDLRSRVTSEEVREPAAGRAGTKRGLTSESLGEDVELLTPSRVPVRDVRLAVTMVGGVALAIYECGVAVEILRAVRGEGMYGLLKRLTQSHVIADVFSGTSAGGINNICLAGALANGTDLSGAETLWIEGGDVDKLLQKPENPGATTLFDGNGYYFEQIEALFGSIVAEPRDQNAPLTSCAPHPDAARPGEVGTLNREMDLLVTGTYFEGQGRAYFDENGSAVYTEDYNGVFRLTHRPKRAESHLTDRYKEPEGKPSPGSEPSSDAEEEARRAANTDARRAWVRARLGRVARTTSSLPAVFEPSQVKRCDVGETIHLPNEVDRPRNFLFDGGFLNNRPLDLALEAVYQRAASRETSRWVVFVEPVAVEPRPLSGEAYPPNALQAVAFWNQVPSRQSLSGCLSRLFQVNGRIRDVGHLLADRRRAVPPNVTDLHEFYEESTTRELWARTCLRVLTDDLHGLWAEALGVRDVGKLIYTGTATGAKLEKEQSRQRDVSERLNRVTKRLGEHLARTCRDLNGPETPDGWELDDIDTTLLLRLIERARSEVRDFRFPTIEEQERERADIARRAARTGDVVQDWVRELNHVQDMAEILRGNAGLVVQTLAKTPWYEKAAAEPTEQNIAALHRAVQEAFSVLARVVTSPPPVEPRERGALAREAQDLRDALTDRSERICAALERAGKETKNARGARSVKATLTEVFGADEKTDKLVPHLYGRLGWLLAQIADDLGTPLRRIARQLEEAPPEEREAEPHEPFVWASLLLEKGDALCWDAPTRSLNALKVLDIHLYPTERASNLAGGSLDYHGQARADQFTLPTHLPVSRPVKLMYVSPRSQQKGLSRRDWDKKIAGDGLGNTSGFMKRSWRANDILWGKLDTAVGLLDTLADPERLERVRRGAAGRPEFADRFLSAIDTYIDQGDETGRGTRPEKASDTGAFVREECWSRNRAVVAGWLLDQGVSAKQAAEALKEAVLLRHQMDTLGPDLRRVLVEDMTEYVQQTARGMAPEAARRAPQNAALSTTERLRAGADELSLLFAAPLRSLTGTPQLRRVNAEDLVDRALRDPEGGSQTRLLHRYFTSEYRVGEECFWENIAPLTSLRRGSQALLLALQLVSRGTEGITTGAGGNLRRALVAPLKLLSSVAWVLYSFTGALAQGGVVQAAVLAALAATLVLIPVAAFLNLFNPATGAALFAWGAWVLGLGLAAGLSLFRGRRRAALVWMLGALGLVLAVSVFAAFFLPPPTRGVRLPLWYVPADWRLAIGEVLLLTALLLHSTLGRDGSLNGWLARAKKPPMVFVFFAGAGFALLLLAAYALRLGQAGGTAQEIERSATILGRGLLAATLVSGATAGWLGYRLARLIRRWKLKNAGAPEGFVGFELASSEAESVAIMNSWTEEVRYKAMLDADGGLTDAETTELRHEAASQAAFTRLREVRQSIRADGGSLDDWFAIAYGVCFCCLLVWAAQGFLYSIGSSDYLVQTATRRIKAPDALNTVVYPALIAFGVLFLGMGAAVCDLIENGKLARILDVARSTPLVAGRITPGAIGEVVRRNASGETGDSVVRRASLWASLKFGLLLLAGFCVGIGFLSAFNVWVANLREKVTAEASVSTATGPVSGSAKRVPRGR